MAGLQWNFRLFNLTLTSALYCRQNWQVRNPAVKKWFAKAQLLDPVEYAYRAPRLIVHKVFEEGRDRWLPTVRSSQGAEERYHVSNAWLRCLWASGIQEVQRENDLEVLLDITLYIRKCDTCESNKKPIIIPRAPLGSMRSGAPVDFVATDFLGPLPVTDRGNR